MALPGGGGIGVRCHCSTLMFIVNLLHNQLTSPQPGQQQRTYRIRIVWFRFIEIGNVYTRPKRHVRNAIFVQINVRCEMWNEFDLSRYTFTIRNRTENTVQLCLIIPHLMCHMSVLHSYFTPVSRMNAFTEPSRTQQPEIPSEKLQTKPNPNPKKGMENKSIRRRFFSVQKVTFD